MKKPKQQVSMSKQSCRTRRVSAMLVSLLLLLSVFLSACGTDERVSGQSGDLQSDANETSLYESSAVPETSEESSADPTPVPPEESETTVELVKEYPLGMEGVFVYLLFEDDPSAAQIIAPYDYYLDESGDLYWFQDSMIRDVERQITISVGSRYASYGYAYGGTIYTLNGNILTEYTFDGESTKEETFANVPKSDSKNYVLFPTDGGVPLIKVDDVIYGADGQTVSVPFTFSTEKAEDGTETGTLSVRGKEYSYGENLRVLGYMDDTLTTRDWQYRRFESKYAYYEYMLCQYDANGNPLSRFMITEEFIPELLPCSVTQGGNECNWYYGRTITIGNEVFEGVMYMNYFMGTDNELYMMLVYPEGGKLYRINAGYSDAEFSELSELTDPTAESES